MIRTDYVLRLIELLGVFLARVSAKIEKYELDESLLETEEMARITTGLPLAVLERTPPEQLDSLFLGPGGSDHMRLAAAAAVLYSRALTGWREANEYQAVHLWINSAHLCVMAARSGDRGINHYGSQLLEEIEDRLREFEIPARLHAALGEHHEASGRWAQAEDHYYEAVAGGEDPQMLPSFYQRLLKLTDSELEAGNLTRDEIDEARSGL